MTEAGSPPFLDALTPHALSTEAVSRSHVHCVTHLQVLQIWFSINLNHAVVVNRSLYPEKSISQNHDCCPSQFVTIITSDNCRRTH